MRTWAQVELCAWLESLGLSQQHQALFPVRLSCNSSSPGTGKHYCRLSCAWALNQPKFVVIESLGILSCKGGTTGLRSVVDKSPHMLLNIQRLDDADMKHCGPERLIHLHIISSHFAVLMAVIMKDACMHEEEEGAMPVEAND